MAGFANFEDINQAYENGRVTTSGFRKLVSSTTATGVWIDLSMTGGGPPPNYYASSPLVWSTLSQSTDGGIYHGGAVSPSSKRLKSLMIASSVVTTSSPSTFMLCDYLGYWPFVDMVGSVSLSGSGLTRYTDGQGVQAMAILVAPQSGGAIFNLTYTSPLGSGRTSKNMKCNTSTVNGTIVTTMPVQTAGYSSSPFIGLQDGDTGILSVQSVNWVTEDVGLISLVLVKPIAQISLSETTASPTIYPPSEKDFAIDNIGVLPEIKDDAYLNLICHPAGTLATAVVWGVAETIWTA
jgi:hypothetical protein